MPYRPSADLGSSAWPRDRQGELTTAPPLYLRRPHEHAQPRQGVGNWAHDMRANGGLPSMAKQGQVTVGTDLVVAPGGVVTRDEVAELIRYSSTTEEVSQPPTLVVPHPFGRYYFLDLTPGRSFVEHASGRGIQTFLLSWRSHPRAGAVGRGHLRSSGPRRHRAGPRGDRPRPMSTSSASAPAAS